jgi:peptidoglycan/xylan/chitin deacetylase (PgdA/CDA1 family)/GT2 family glycosyltransferase
VSKLDVAVVIPCYELGRTLGEAIESVEAQTYAPAEIVVVDDGSRDPYTLHVLRRLDDRATLLSTSNGGPATARNLGIQSTRSPLLVLLDADDALEPTYLEKAAALLERRPDLGFVSCALQAFGNASYRWKPPPFSPAETLGRGACGHISTMFRRGVWECVGGFDASLPAYEDLDFWLSALEFGFEGEILDEALVRYRVRQGSRYHRGISAATYQRAKAALLERHPGSLHQYDEDVFVSLIDFQREIGSHRRSLIVTQAQLERERTTADGEVEEATQKLEELGGTPFEWGELLRRARVTDASPGETISAFYQRAFLANHPDATGPSAVTIRGGEPWPTLDGDVETLVVLEAFEHEDDLHGALKTCREALTPGGVLLATFSVIPPRENGALRGFTEASVRTLLAEQFPPAAVDVTVYGNLRACLAEIGGLAPHSLEADELRYVDPWHPVLIAACCQVTATGAQPASTGQCVSSAPRHTPRTAVRNRGIVLAFHRVAELMPDVHSNCVSPDVFRAQMEVLSEKFAPISLADMVSTARDGDIPPRAVAVTFDDGYLDNFLVASPILSELSIPATFFLTTERIDEKREAWWDLVEWLLCSDDDVPERLQIDVEAGHFDLPTATPEERYRALFILHGTLLEAAVDARNDLLSALLAWGGKQHQARETHRLMTADEVRTLSKRPGHEVGAHTVHHLMLPSHSLDVQRRELSENRETLERITGRPVRTLAYPYGACDLSTTEMAESAGFTIAASVTDEVVTPDADPFRLPRVEVTNRDRGSLRSKLDYLFEEQWCR